MRFAAAVALTCALATPLQASPVPTLASVSPGPEFVRVQPAASGLALVVTVSGPRGVVLRHVGEPGQEIQVELVDPAGRRLGDGDYQYEVRPATAQSGATSLDAQSGGFRVRAGRVETQGGSARVGEPAESPRVPDDQVIADDLIVQGGLCAAGSLCTNGEDFGAADLKIKRADAPALMFEDDDTTGATTDWRLITGTGGIENFSIDYMAPGSPVPFRIDGGSPSNALRIDSVGRVGLGTATPQEPLDIAHPSQAAILLESASNRWRLFNDFSGFGAARLPTSGAAFYIFNAAPAASLWVNSSGQVGMGSSSPAAALHVLRSNSTAKVLVEETSSTVIGRNLLQIKNNGASTFRFDNTASGQLWGFGSLGSGNFFIGATPGQPLGMTLTPAGNMVLTGTLTQSSSRDAKRDFEQIDPAAVLEKLAALPLSTWSYKADAGARHLGPMAQDFATSFGLGPDDEHIAPSDLAGVALAAIQALKAENGRLAEQNGELARRLERLEAAVGSAARR